MKKGATRMLATTMNDQARPRLRTRPVRSRRRVQPHGRNESRDAAAPTPSGSPR